MGLCGCPKELKTKNTFTTMPTTKNINNIWEMQWEDGSKANGFNDIEALGEAQFEKLYKDYDIANITKFVEMTTFFPTFVIKEAHEIFMKEICKEELKIVSEYCRRIKFLDSMVGL